MSVVCGIDGCRKGWVVICKILESSQFFWQLCTHATDFLHLNPFPSVMGIDIPIGLPEKGPRLCDVEARKLLGRDRRASIFPAPIRAVLRAKNYKEACRIRFQIERKKLSLQTWGIVPKVKEVDALMRKNPQLQNTIREVHPEVSFYFLNKNNAMRFNKKTQDGFKERYKLLKSIFANWLDTVLILRNKLGSAPDDILDAFVALWSAERIYKGISVSFPSHPVKDSYGLKMEILA